jgi:hypothetical protein
MDGCCACAAIEQRDELAALHSITSSGIHEQLALMVTSDLRLIPTQISERHWLAR